MSKFGDFLDSAGGAIGGFLGGVGNFITGEADRRAAERNTRMTIEANKREAELAYQRQVEFWHMQNEYNSPAAQMARFGAAGLNPHLIYGQGSSGNAQGTPAYHPPRIEYQFARNPTGPAIATILPTLMQVGQWMQNMRMSEAEIQSKLTNTEKAEQLIGFLTERNPRELRKLDEQLQMFPYQRSMMFSNQSLVNAKANDLLMSTAWKFGEERTPPREGLLRIEYAKRLAEMELKRAQASWTDFNITNPQALIQLVLGGVMGMAGQTLRLSNRGSVRSGKSWEQMHGRELSPSLRKRYIQMRKALKP